jgi:hypothetical protein
VVRLCEEVVGTPKGLSNQQQAAYSSLPQVRLCVWVFLGAVRGLLRLVVRWCEEVVGMRKGLGNQQQAAYSSLPHVRWGGGLR